MKRDCEEEPLLCSSARKVTKYASNISENAIGPDKIICIQLSTKIVTTSDNAESFDHF